MVDWIVFEAYWRYSVRSNHLVLNEAHLEVDWQESSMKVILSLLKTYMMNEA